MHRSLYCPWLFTFGNKLCFYKGLLYINQEVYAEVLYPVQVQDLKFSTIIICHLIFTNFTVHNNFFCVCVRKIFKYVTAL